MSWKTWKLTNFRKLRFIGIWNDACCSNSLKFEIPSTFLGKNVMEINSKMSWKSWKLTQKCLGKSWKLAQCPEISWKFNWKISWKVLEINSKMSWKALKINSKMSWKVLEISSSVLESPEN